MIGYSGYWRRQLLRDYHPHFTQSVMPDMNDRWDTTRRFWDDVHHRNQMDYSLTMKARGPASQVFAQGVISRQRNMFRGLLKEGAKAERLKFSDFRLKRKWLPKDRAKISRD